MKRRRPRQKRKFRLAAFVTRKVEEHAKLAADSMRIALGLTLIVLAFMLVTTFYKAWNERPSPAPAPTQSTRR